MFIIHLQLVFRFLKQDYPTLGLRRSIAISLSKVSVSVGTENKPEATARSTWNRKALRFERRSLLGLFHVEHQPQSLLSAVLSAIADHRPRCIAM